MRNDDVERPARSADRRGSAASLFPSRSALRAPQQDGAILACPGLADAGRLLAGNQRCLLPVNELRIQARREAVAAAVEYLRESGEPVPEVAAAAPLLLAGHQPELFHPGVWIKNFALHGLAQQHGLCPLHLIIDNDTAKSTAVRVPVPPSQDGAAGVRLLRVPFDGLPGAVPYEELPVRDQALSASFSARVGALLAGWGLRPILPVFWEEVQRQAKRTALLGERFSAARRALERQWGCRNLELPISRLARTAAFGRFALQLLSERERWHAIYNEEVQRYRSQHGIRSKNHPVPDLASDGDWREVPLWGWRPGEPRRGRLLASARGGGGGLQLRCGRDPWPELPPPASPAAWAAWQELARQGYRVRPRALTTTLFSRIFLADLFLHGIGGGIYDALTDQIARRFYNIVPPAYLVLSGTLHLPLPVHAVGEADRLRLAQQLRDLDWNPQRHLLPDSSEVRDLLQRKQELLHARPAGPTERRRWFNELRAVTQALRCRLVRQHQQIAQRLPQLARQLEENAIVQRRDYAFCLFPEEKLRPFCTQFLTPPLAFGHSK